jgi:hypothetical protein
VSVFTRRSKTKAGESDLGHSSEIDDKQIKNGGYYCPFLSFSNAINMTDYDKLFVRLLYGEISNQIRFSI